MDGNAHRLCQQRADYRALWDAQAKGDPPPQAPEKPQPKLLGDHVESALSVVGITKERVLAWFGPECGCIERQEKLNAIDKWARESVASTVEKAKGWLASIIGAKNKPVPPVVEQAFPIRFDETNLAVGLSGHRFNASLMEWQDGYALAWRNAFWGSDIFVSRLDKLFRPVRGSNAKLELTHVAAATSREDPRFFMLRGQPHLMYVGLTGKGRNRVASVLYARLTDRLAVEEVACPHYAQRNGWEKSWSSWEHDGQHYATHSITPHRVLRIDGDKAEVAYETPTLSNWTWGGTGLHGGACPVLVGEEWYSFFHAWKRTAERQRVYATGILTFSAKPPFKALRMTPEPIQVAEPNTFGWYADCTFPAGLVRLGDDWILSSGEHDRTTRLDRFSAESIELALKPIS